MQDIRLTVIFLPGVLHTHAYVVLSELTPQTPNSVVDVLFICGDEIREVCLSDLNAVISIGVWVDFAS